MRFVLFGCIRGCSLAYETRCETGRTSAKVSATKSHRNFSQRTLRKTRIGPKLTFWCVSYYFGAFRTVWLPKLGAKRSKLVQKFVPRSCVRIFAPNTPNPPHWTLNWHFGAFRTISMHSVPFGCLTKLGAIRAELVQKFVPWSRVGIFCNEHTQSTPLDPKLMFQFVS